ncbi:DUF721 domain-containing protein [Vannielia litorea]|uniref:DUF721 domain-containing protein n=1 Tax=Vannielia litorea TaxID=1217970 RepID=UPI001BCBA93D|nr:DciA family protein [Vannielia litorea]MBS8225400.1 DUF721 domain-containing protein [Vannielia litorea]
MSKAPEKSPKRHMRGFAQTARFVSADIRKASEKRGFAEMRVLTHWAEIVGAETAAVTRPLEVKFGRGAFGATLRVLTTGANAPMLEMQKEQIRERINAVYGYAAISRIQFTQTAPTGFAEGQADFNHAPKRRAQPAPAQREAAEALAQGVTDPALKAALSRLGAHVIHKSERG